MRKLKTVLFFYHFGDKTLHQMSILIIGFLHLYLVSSIFVKNIWKGCIEMFKVPDWEITRVFFRFLQLFQVKDGD